MSRRCATTSGGGCCRRRSGRRAGIAATTRRRCASCGAIKEAQAVGFTLAEIAEYLRAARRSRSPSEALRVRMAAKIDQIDARIAALRRMRDELARVVGCACSLARSLHLRRRLPRSPRQGADNAAVAPARHQRRKRRQHAAPDRARRRRAVRGRTCSTRGRCRRCRGSSCCGHAPASSPTAAGVASRRCSHRSSGATGSCSRRCATACRSCSGSSTTSTTSSNSSTCSRSPTPRRPRPS